MQRACFAVAGRPVRFLAKSPLLRMPVLGWIIRSSGAIPVYRHQDDPGQMRKNVEVLKEAHWGLDRDGPWGSSPRGRSHGDPAISPLRTGAAQDRSRCRPGSGWHLSCLEHSHIPLGLSFSHKESFRSAALVVVGERSSGRPASAHAEDPREMPEETRCGGAHPSHRTKGCEAVTLNLERWEDAPLVACAEAVHRAENEAHGGAVERAERLERSRLVAEALHELRQNDPERLGALLPAVARFHRALRTLGLSADDLDLDPGMSSFFRRRLLSLALFFLSLPVLLLGSIGLCRALYGYRSPLSTREMGPGGSLYGEDSGWDRLLRNLGDPSGCSYGVAAWRAGRPRGLFPLCGLWPEPHNGYGSCGMTSIGR